MSCSSKKVEGGRLLTGSSVTIDLPFQPSLFFRHGWQSWSLSTWLDPSLPQVPIRMQEFRTKDEDPVYASSSRHISAGLGAVEMPDGQVLLLGGLGLEARVESKGHQLLGFYETGEGEWFLSIGKENDVFSRYAQLISERLGQRRSIKAPSVWCSWYSLYNFINEKAIQEVLDELGDLPFDVIQIDDGWQITAGDWEPNRKFPSGMAALADLIRKTGRIPGLWLAPLMVSCSSRLFRHHQDWVLHDVQGNPVSMGLNWSGRTVALDITHAEVQDWLAALIRKVCGWGYGYLKLDFLYAGALPGKKKTDLPREQAYRQTLRIMREAAGDAFLLACAAPVIPSLGLCDGLRIGPDVTPFWLNSPMSVSLNNPSFASTRNALRTSLHRLWLKPLVHTDPDVVYFRSRHNQLNQEQASLLRDLASISGFKATSDLPQWLTLEERKRLRIFLRESPEIERLGRYRFQLDRRQVDFASCVPLPKPRRYPLALAKLLGIGKIVFSEGLPAVAFALKHK